MKSEDLKLTPGFWICCSTDTESWQFKTGPLLVRSQDPGFCWLGPPVGALQTEIEAQEDFRPVVSSTVQVRLRSPITWR